MSDSRHTEIRASVLFLTKYQRQGPSSRYRVLQFLPALEREGFACDIQSLHTDAYLDALYTQGRPAPGYHAARFLRRLFALFAAVRYDAVFIQKELFPYLPPFAERMLASLGGHLIYDLDDAIFLRYERSERALVRWMLGRKVPAVIARSNVVLCGNEFLRDYAAQYTKNAVLFPTVVDPARYGSGANRPAERDTPVIGWIGSPETSPYLHELWRVLVRVASSHRFELLVIGDPGFTLPPIGVQAVPWSEEQEAPLLRRCDIGIMPLPDSLWAKGKCGLKLLQYMAAGLPVVTAPGGSAETIVEHGRSGLIARTDEEWAAHLVSLLDDPARGRSMGEEGRRRVRQRYSLSVWAPVMAEILGRVVRGERVTEVSP
jgi:glycosyltransferase involved in cell wall biosynthesis